MPRIVTNVVEDAVCPAEVLLDVVLLLSQIPAQLPASPAACRQSNRWEISGRAGGGGGEGAIASRRIKPRFRPTAGRVHLTHLKERAEENDKNDVKGFDMLNLLNPKYLLLMLLFNCFPFLLSLTARYVSVCFYGFHFRIGWIICVPGISE